MRQMTLRPFQRCCPARVALTCSHQRVRYTKSLYSDAAVALYTCAMAKKKARVAKWKYAVWLTDPALAERLKAHASKVGQPVSRTAEVILNVALTPGYPHPGGGRNATEAEVQTSLKRVMKHRKSLAKLADNDGLGTPKWIANPEPADVAADVMARKTDAVACRRAGCAHDKSAHTRGEQHACAAMGCNCSRFM